MSLSLQSFCRWYCCCGGVLVVWWQSLWGCEMLGHVFCLDLEVDQMESCSFVVSAGLFLVLESWAAGARMLQPTMQLQQPQQAPAQDLVLCLEVQAEVTLAG